MLSSLEILTTLRDLIDAHDLWPEVEQYGRCDKAWIESAIYQIEHKEVQVLVDSARRSTVFAYPTITLTTTQLHDLCFGAAVDDYALVNGEPVLPAPTAWQRNLDRHGVKYELTEPGVSRRITQVKLELTPEEWCDLCMRSGRYYVGSSKMQDIVNQVFRDAGWIVPTYLCWLEDLMRCRDPYSSYCTDAALLLRWSSRIDPLSPWERIGVLWQLAGEHLEETL